MKLSKKRTLIACFAVAMIAGTAFAQEVKITDESGDDNGPGEYVYPTDNVYSSGSFDIVEFKLKQKGKRANVSVTLAGSLSDPWRMGSGFSTQMAFVLIDTDGKEGSGFTETPPGLNVKIDPAHAWDKCIILSPQQSSRVAQEVQSKAASMESAIIVPSRVRGAGRTITASVGMDQLGEGDITKWRYQVLMQSNEGFPGEGDLLTRKVNEYEGQHRFGGGTDYDCDPHVLDILGDNSMLAYECGEDGEAVKPATIKLIAP